MKLPRYGHDIECLGQRYRLEGLLGSGGMADVCLAWAWDEDKNCEVAVKVIKPDMLDRETLNRFLKEGLLVVRWDHPHILPVYNVELELLDAARGSMVPYIVMKRVQGGNLQQRLTDGQPYSFGETLRIFAQICNAVQYAHERKVIHRDIKPANILYDRLPSRSEQVVLSDFGLAVEIDASHYTFPQGGSLPYMAPEQLRGKPQLASDIFALGVVLYRLCTGRLPFARSKEDLSHPRPQRTPPRPSTINPDLPKALDDVILTALAENPLQRFPTAAQLWESVRVGVKPPSIQPPKPSGVPKQQNNSQVAVAGAGAVAPEGCWRSV